MRRYSTSLALMALALATFPEFAFAADGGAVDAGTIAVGAGIAMGLAALGGTLGQGKAISSGLDAIGRNPSAQGKIFIPMLIGLAFVESLVILSFVIAFFLQGAVTG